MKTNLFLIFIACLLFVHAVSAQSSPNLILENGVAPHKGLDDVYRRFSEGYRSLDAAQVAGLYTESASYLAPGGDAQFGRQKILENFKSFFDSVKKQNGKAEISFRILQRQADKSMAYDVGISRLHQPTPKASRALVEENSSSSQGARKTTFLKDIKTVVAFYAPPVNDAARTSPTDPRPNMIDFVGQVKVPAQYHFGTADRVITLADIQKFQQKLKAEKAKAEFYLYENSGHAFYDYTRPNLHNPAAKLAYERMRDFLKKQLG